MIKNINRILSCGLLGILACTSLHAGAFGWIDGINQTAFNPGDQLTGGGWAADYDTVCPLRQIDIHVDGVTVCYASLGADRPDVAAAYGRPEFELSGYTFAWNIAGLTPGPHEVTVWAWGPSGPAELSGSKTFNVLPVNQPPVDATPSAWIDNNNRTQVYQGHAITLHLGAECSSGINEFGLELCDSAGTPLANLGIRSGGSRTAKDDWIGPWQPPGLGVYYFKAYAWNNDRSQLARSPVFSVNVVKPPVLGQDAKTVSGKSFSDNWIALQSVVVPQASGSTHNLVTYDSRHVPANAGNYKMVIRVYDITVGQELDPAEGWGGQAPIGPGSKAVVKVPQYDSYALTFYIQCPQSPYDGVGAAVSLANVVIMDDY